MLEATLSLFAEQGYEATTVDDITKKAGVAVGGFYLHFRTKRQALLVLMDLLIDELDRRPVMARVERTSTAIEHLRAGLQLDWSYAGAYRAWREAVLGDASLASLHAEIEAWTTTRIAAALRAAAAAPGARAQVDIASLAWILSVLFWRSIEAPVKERETIVNTVVTFVEHAVFEDRAFRAGDR